MTHLRKMMLEELERRPPTNENREKQSHLTNEPVIMVIEAKMQPQRVRRSSRPHANTCLWCEVMYEVCQIECDQSDRRRGLRHSGLGLP